MQSLVSKAADTSHYDFKTADWYDEDEIEGKKIVIEAMFLNPFCSSVKLNAHLKNPCYFRATELFLDNFSKSLKSKGFNPKRCGLFGQLRRLGGRVQNGPLRESGLWMLQFSFKLNK